MNYRHAFHAGNFADVFKHATLALALSRLTAKPKPLRVIDTHAGRGIYLLGGPEALRTNEWRGGIGRLLGPDAPPLPPEIEALLAPYLTAVRSLNPAGEMQCYPGSPVLTLALLRPEDRLVASELHPEDAAGLRHALAHDRRAKVLEIDGWRALRALLPPRERRGLVLIDPPFEEAGEMERLASGLREGIRRFATGTFILWFPIKEPRQVANFEQALARMQLAKLLWAELRCEEVATAERLAATGLVILNPPFGLEEQMRLLLPFLAERLATGNAASWRLEHIGAAA